MGLRLRFTVFDEQQVNRVLEGLDNRARDMRPAWDEVREYFSDYEERWFLARGRGWRPLSRSYERWKARHFPGKPIMVRTGELEQSLEEPSIDIREPTYAIFGTDVPYAGYHQRGGGRLPQRRVIDFDEPGRREIARFVQRHLIEER